MRVPRPGASAAERAEVHRAVDVLLWPVCASDLSRSLTRSVLPLDHLENTSYLATLPGSLVT